MQAILKKWGNSQGIRIPKAFLEAMNIRENDTLNIERVDDSIVIKKNAQTSGLTISDIFAGYEGNYEPEEYDWGAPVGKEIW